MANSIAFDFVCEELELRSSLDRLEARGTVRLALKQAGLDARTTTPAQMKIVCEKILPTELSARGVDGLDALSCSLIDGLGSLTAEPVADSPETVFQRLGGGA